MPSMGLFSDGPRRDAPDLKQVVEAARKRLQENPADAAAVLKLADALAGSGRKTEAVRILNRFGPIVQSKGRLEQAIAIWWATVDADKQAGLEARTMVADLRAAFLEL